MPVPAVLRGPEYFRQGEYAGPGHVFGVTPVGNRFCPEVSLSAQDHFRLYALWYRIEKIGIDQADHRVGRVLGGQIALQKVNVAMRSEERRVGKECVSTCRYRL